MLVVKFFLVGLFMVAQPDGKVVEKMEALSNPFDTVALCEESKKEQTEALNDMIKQGAPIKSFVMDCKKVEMKAPVVKVEAAPKK
jgi:hypothetical protein